MEKEAKGITDELQEEVQRLEKTISELHRMASLDDHVLCLQVGGNSHRQHGILVCFSQGLLSFIAHLLFHLRASHLLKRWTVTGVRSSLTRHCLLAP